MLKKKLELDKFGKIILHVGQITRVRELEKLIEISSSLEYKIIVIGASSIPADPTLKEEIIKSGIVVIDEFIDHLEWYYQVSDIFIFPGTTSSFYGAASAIEIPLSVLEAMACNIPIISGQFGGLPSFFNEDDYFIYANSGKEIIEAIKKIECLNKTIKNREKVLGYSWANLTIRLIELYENLSVS